MTSFALRSGSPARARTDIVVIGVVQRGKGSRARLELAPGAEDIAKEYGRSLSAMLSSMGFTGKPNQTLRVPTHGTIAAGQLVLVGLGKWQEGDTEALRRAAGAAARSLSNADTVSVALPADDAASVNAVVDGFRSGCYSYHHKTKSTEAGTDAAPNQVNVLSAHARRGDVQEAFDAAAVLGAAVDKTRDWVNCPPNALPPAVFADEVAAQVKQTVKTLGKNAAGSLSVKVYDEEDLAELGCGGILGVGQASANPPRLVKITWEPTEPVATLAYVGKGITFDSGGLSIKPAASMATMKLDMAGAAAVANALTCIARLGLPVAVTGWLPMAENMVSGTSMRPSDVITMRNGKTVEVRNTDAEGRLILADAICLAVEGQPDQIIEVSTLTGAITVALGTKIAGLFGDEASRDLVAAAAEETGEMFWPMPIPEEIAAKVRNDSPIADLLQHDGVRFGGASFAAAFVREFADDVPFAHLDIAGAGYNEKSPWGHVPSGGTGFGVTTLVELARQQAEDD